LKKALQDPPAYARFDLQKFLRALHQQGFPKIEWTAIEWVDVNLNKD
jgi:hypothetical protein